MNSILKIKNVFFEKLKKNPKIIVILGLVGIALVFISGFSQTKTENNKVSSVMTASDYSESLEKELSEQISEVVGGKVKVMVTLETGVEYIYASEAKNNESNIEDADSNNKQKLQKDKKSENNYILYKDENGNEVPLVVTEVMPSVKGVVVGCENGENESLSAVVKNLVKTALNISDDKVCVVGLDIIG